MKTKYFIDCNSIEQVKRRFKELAFVHHPDKGGDTATMQEINKQYAEIIRNPHFKGEKQTEEEKEESLRYPEIINQLINLNGLVIELIGDWIWLSGNTYAHRQSLKEIGFFYAPKKMMWYYRPSEYKSSNKTPLSIDDIRRKYGSDILDNHKQVHQIN